MRAATYSEYGGPEVVRVSTLERPEPSANELRVRVVASSVTTADWRIRASAFPGGMWLPGRLMFGLFKPRKPVLGVDFSGVVDAVGEDVTEFAVGDAVFGVCNQGGHAEYLCMDARKAVVKIPESMAHHDAAALPFGALCALVFLRDVIKIQPQQKILILGGTGGVGCYAVQLAAHLGAEVTAVGSTQNLDLMRRLGATHVVDYTTTDALKQGRFDVIFDTVGAAKFYQAKRALVPGGVFVPLNFSVFEAFQGLWSRILGGKKMLIAVNGDHKADLEVISAMVQSGDLHPVIDRRFGLRHIVEAHQYVQKRRRRGSVVIDVAEA